MANGTTELTDGERILLLAVMEPFTFMPDGMLEPLSSQRVRELWWAIHAQAVGRELEPA